MKLTIVAKGKKGIPAALKNPSLGGYGLPLGKLKWQSVEEALKETAKKLVKGKK